MTAAAQYRDVRPVIAAVAVGSNVGDRAAHVRGAAEALARLPSTALLAFSRAIETEPVVPEGVEGGGAYLNAAAVLRTSLPPERLLAGLLEIEAAHGRDRARATRYGPRPLDLDLLLYGDQVLESDGLVVPHPRMQEREFVLAPLAEIAPGLVVPTVGRSVGELLMVMRQSGRAGS